MNEKIATGIIIDIPITRTIRVFMPEKTAQSTDLVYLQGERMKCYYQTTAIIITVVLLVCIKQQLFAQGTVTVDGTNYGNYIDLTTYSPTSDDIEFNGASGAQDAATAYVGSGQVVHWSGDLLMSSAGIFNIDSGSEFLFSGTASGNGPFIKNGLGSYILESGLFPVNTIHVNQGEFTMRGISNLTAPGISPDFIGMTVASGASLRLSPDSSGSPCIANTLIEMQGQAQLILEMRDYPTIATFDQAIPVMNPNNIVFEGISYLAPTDTRTVEFLNISSGQQAVISSWNALFDKPLINVDNPVSGTYSMTINAVSLSDFANSTGGFTANQLMQVADLETERQNPSIGSDRRNTFEVLYNSPDASRILNTLLLVTEETNPIADTISAFNIGQAALMGDIAFATSRYWFGKNNQTGPQSQNSNTIVRGQSPGSSLQKPILYFQPYYRSVKSDTRDIREGYGITKMGFLSGVTIDTDSTTSVGVLFGYSNPELYQTDRNVRMNDLHIGMMAVKTLPQNFDLGVLFSMGWQEGRSNRYPEAPNQVDSALTRYRLYGEMSGYTFNATANLGKRIELGKYVMLKPTVGVDYEGMGLSTFTEKTDGSVPLTGSMYDNILGRRTYDNCRFDRVLFKAGVAGSLSGSKAGISGKVLYGTQLGGSDIAFVNATILDGVYAGSERHYSSLPIGRDFIYFDGGIHRYVNQKKTALLYASYNATLYSHTTDQTVLLGFQWMN